VVESLLREKEVLTPTASVYLLVAASIGFILYDEAIAAIVLTFVAVGDPVAGMVGERWGKLSFSVGPRSGRGLRASLAKLICEDNEKKKWRRTLIENFAS